MSKVAKIQRKIVCVMYVQNVWISKKIECPKLRKLIKKFCKLHVRNVWICRKILYLELRKFNGKSCTLYMSRTFGFAEILNIQNYENSTGNCLHYIWKEWQDSQKNWISRGSKIQQQIGYVIYVRNVWICIEIERPEQHKFNEKFFTLYIRNIWICRKT